MSVQQTIIRGIKEQLFFNNYLVLPNFGGFVLKANPSQISASGGLLVPPSKTVTFNAQLKQNDGILAIWLQNTLKCHASEALNHLTDFSDFCAGILQAKRRLSLEGIGFFYLDFENNICFEPQQDANFLTRSFGLGPISIKELEVSVAPEPKKEPVFVDRTLQSADVEKDLAPVTRKRNYQQILVPVLLVVMLITLLGLLINNRNFQGDLRAALFETSLKGSYSMQPYSDLHMMDEKAKVNTYIADANGISTIDLAGAKKIAVKVLDNTFTSAPLNHSNSNIVGSATKGNFEIVLGCFTVLENAKRMVNKLAARHIHADVKGKNEKGMYVVSDGSYSSREQAIQRLLEVKDAYPHAWIKKEE